MMKEILMIPSVLPTVQLFLFLGAIVSLAWLVMKYLTQQGSEAGKKPSIHLYYLIGIGSLLLIELVTYILTGVGDVSRVIFDQISFASTISSILLSVIAIIYSIVSGSNGANLYVKTEEVSKRIADTLPKFEVLDMTVEELKRVPDEVKGHLSKIETQMKCMEELSNKMSRQLDDVASCIPNLPESFASKVREFSVPSSEALNEPNSSGAKEKEVFLNQYISASPVSGLLALLVCYYAYESKKSIPMKDKLFSGELLSPHYLLGYVAASCALGLVGVEEVTDQCITIGYVHEVINIKEKVDKVLSRKLKRLSATDEESEMIARYVREIKIFFGFE